MDLLRKISHLGTLLVQQISKLLHYVLDQIYQYLIYRCSFDSYQDILYVHSERQLYWECDFYGTVDFIFNNNAAVVFQNCNLFARNAPKKINTITAQGRTNPNQNTSISFHNSRVTAASNLKTIESLVKTYLGRPWQH